MTSPREARASRARSPSGRSVALRSASRRGGGSGGEDLQVAEPRARPLARGAVELDGHVAELAGGADRAAVELAVQDRGPPPIPVPSVSRTRCSRTPPRAETVLGDRGGVRVVLERDRHAEPLLQPVAEVDPGERHVHRRPASAGALVDERRDPDAERDRVLVRELGDRGTRAARRARPATRSPCRASRRSRIPPSRSTRATASFVPPRSSAIACRWLTLTRRAARGRGYHTPSSWRPRTSPTRSTGAGARGGPSSRSANRATGARTAAAATARSRRRSRGTRGRRIRRVILLPRPRARCSSALVWGLLGYLSVSRGVKEANDRLPDDARTALSEPEGSILTTSQNILVLGADVGGKSAERQGTGPFGLDDDHPHRPRRAPARVPLDPARPLRERSRDTASTRSTRRTPSAARRSRSRRSRR